jgi:hypothetical protein
MPRLKLLKKQFRKDGAATDFDDNVRPLRRSELRPLLGNEHDAAILLVLARVLLAFVQDAEVVRLRDTNKLTVVALGPHHSLVVQLVHGGRYAKAAKTKTFQFILKQISLSNMQIKPHWWGVWFFFKKN